MNEEKALDLNGEIVRIKQDIQALLDEVFDSFEKLQMSAYRLGTLYNDPEHAANKERAKLLAELAQLQKENVALRARLAELAQSKPSIVSSLHRAVDTLENFLK